MKSTKICFQKVLGIVVSLLLLLTVFPLIYVAVALWVKRRSPGPAIVLRPRRRADGRQYMAYRFRLPDENSLLARMPQLMNVLGGDVSLYFDVSMLDGEPVAEEPKEIAEDVIEEPEVIVEEAEVLDEEPAEITEQTEEPLEEAGEEDVPEMRPYSESPSALYRQSPDDIASEATPYREENEPI